MSLLPYYFNKIYFGTGGNGKIPTIFPGGKDPLSSFPPGKTLIRFPDKESSGTASMKWKLQNHFPTGKAQDHLSRKVAPNFSSTFFNSFSWIALTNSSDSVFSGDR